MASKKSPEQRLEELRQQREQVEQQLKQKRKKLQRDEQRQRAKIQNQKRKEDTRRKVLVGAAVLNQVEQGRMDQAELERLLDGFLERDDDRALFGLNPRGDTPETDQPG